MGGSATLYFNPCQTIKVVGCEGENSIGFVKGNGWCLPISQWGDKKDDRTDWGFDAINPITDISTNNIPHQITYFVRSKILSNFETKVPIDSELESYQSLDLMESKGIKITANNMTTHTKSISYNFQMI